MKKLLTIIFLLLILSSCFNKSNVYKGEDDKNLVEKNESKEEIKNEPKKELKEEKIEEISKEKLIKNIKTVEWWKNLKEKIEKISKFKTSREIDKLLILKSTVWEISEVLKAKEEYCDKFKMDVHCMKFRADFVVEELVDQNNSRIFWKDDLWLSLDQKEIEFKHMFSSELNYQMDHILKVTKKWYIWFYKTFYSWIISPENKFRLKPKLEKYTFSKNIKSSEWFSHKTENYEFILEPDTFVYKSWKKVLWDIDLYLFDIKNKDLSIFSLKKFDRETLSYLWRWVKNDSFALVKAYKWNEELKINKPVKVLSNLNNIKFNGNYSNLIPKNKILTVEEKEKYNLPFIWNLDFDSWIWLTSDLKVLNKKLDIEFTLN